MAERIQTYGSHRRFIPEFHFLVLPVLVANFVMTIVSFVRDPRPITAWYGVLALALLIGIWTARAMALRAQDRIIRLEETARLDRVLPPDLRGRATELRIDQLIAIRFAPDEEVPDIYAALIAGSHGRRGAHRGRCRIWRT